MLRRRSRALNAAATTGLGAIRRPIEALSEAVSKNMAEIIEALISRDDHPAHG